MTLRNDLSETHADMGAAVVRALKNRLRRYPAAQSLWTNGVYFSYALREGLWRALFRIAGEAKNLERQTTIVWNIPELQARTPQEFVSWLRARGIQVNEGSNALYIPPQQALNVLIPSVVGFYPVNSGFKVLKDLRPPAEANYVAGKGSPLVVRTKLVGTPQDQLITANYMYAAGLGPRLWDLCCWQGGTISCTVFVVDHISGKSPSNEQCTAFINRLKQLSTNSLLRVVIPNWEQQSDFECPGCNRNLFIAVPSGDPQYVDFQNFKVTSATSWTRQILDEAKDDLHFGHGRLWRGHRYLYQSIPRVTNGGKRNTTKRWAFITSQLNRIQLDLRDRVVLDVGCNAGMMLHSSLASGAAWGFGWDRPSVVRHTQTLLLSLGSSRVTVSAGDLDPTYPLEKDIPDNLQSALPESVVFYLSVRQHVGLLHSLQRIPWRVLVYEGHQSETVGDMQVVLAPLSSKGVLCVATASIADGDCSARPIAILVRD